MSANMARRQSTLGFEQTLIYGQYSEDLAKFARTQARTPSRLSQQSNQFLKKSLFRRLTEWPFQVWNFFLAAVGEDWIFLALLGASMAILSFVMDFCIQHIQKARYWLYNEVLTDGLLQQYIGWSAMPLLLILFSAGFAHMVSPQAVGSGIPEMKTILRGVILHEYLTFQTLVAKVIGLTCSLSSGLPFGKEGPFVHLASIMATLLSKLVTSFQGIYTNESRTGEMLAAACAVGVAATFNAPIGGVLFSIEVTSVFFAVRDYWRGFFAACCGATLWRLLVVWFGGKTSITALFKTHFSSTFPFDPQELVVFALIGVLSGFASAAYIKCHRRLVHFFRNHKKLNAILQKNRFTYPGLMTLLLVTLTFPPFLGQFMASQLSNHDLFDQLFSNITWSGNNNDSTRLKIVKNWTTEYTNIYGTLVIHVFMSFWMTLLASTIPVPAGTFTPCFKLGAAFGRLVGELMVLLFPLGIRFGGNMNPIVPGGYAVVGAAAFCGAATHTISTTVIAFELTGQMTHMIPVIISVLIANAISQTLELSIFDSIIQIKKLPFIPPISATSSTSHHIYVEDMMVREVIFISRNCTYQDIKDLLQEHPTLVTFPLVDSSSNMILLGSMQRETLANLWEGRLSRQRRLQEIRRRNSVHPLALARRMSRFLVTPLPSDDVTDDSSETSPSDLEAMGPKTPKSILKQTLHITYSPNSTIHSLSAFSVAQDSPLRKAFENIFQKSLKLQDANPDKNNDKLKSEANSPATKPRHVQLPRERIIDMSQAEQRAWEQEQLNMTVDLANVTIDAAPFQLVERTTLFKVHSLFSMMSLENAYVTSIGRLVGVVSLKDLRMAIEKMNSGQLLPKNTPDSSYLDSLETDPLYEETASSDDSNLEAK